MHNRHIPDVQVFAERMLSRLSGPDDVLRGKVLYLSISGMVFEGTAVWGAC